MSSDPSAVRPSHLDAIEIAYASEADAENWDRLVESHPEGRYCHLWGYRRALENACGYRCIYMKIQSSGRLIGIFPAIKTRRRGWMISQPFNEYGGPLTLKLSVEASSQLSHHLVETAKREGCKAIEIRGGIGCEEISDRPEWKRIPLHSYAVLDLGNSDHIWKNVITYEARKGVNKARHSGLVAEVRRGSQAIESPFYDLYLLSMKRLGVPPHSIRFFDELAAGIGDRLVASWVLDGGKPAAILLGAVTGARVHIFVIASRPEAWAKRPSDLAHWELIQWACRQDFKVFDFGSARYKGQIQFKKKWGVEFRDYGFYLVGPAETISRMEIQSVKTSSRSMSLLADLWRWGVPIPLTRLLGPPIRRYLTK